MTDDRSEGVLDGHGHGGAKGNLACEAIRTELCLDISADGGAKTAARPMMRSPISAAVT
jgi:hypothetical protein